MTPEACANGTERCAAAHTALGGGYDIVVNLQGDASLTPQWLVEDPIADLKTDPNAEISTPVLRCDGATLNGFLTDRKAGRVGGTTSVFDLNKRVLYFSKEVPARVVIDESLRLSHAFAEQGHNHKNVNEGKNWIKSDNHTSIQTKSENTDQSYQSTSPQRKTHTKRKDTNKSSRFINNCI